MRERAYKHRIASLEQQIGSLQEQLSQEIHRSSSLMATNADRVLSGVVASAPSPVALYANPTSAGLLTNGISSQPLTHELLDRFSRTCATPASSVQSAGTGTTTSGVALTTPRSLASGAQSASTSAGLTPTPTPRSTAHFVSRAIRSRSPSERSGASFASRGSSIRSSLRSSVVPGAGSLAPQPHASSVLTNVSRSSTSSGARSLSNCSNFSQQTALRVPSARHPAITPLPTRNPEIVIVASSSPPVRD